MVFVSRDFEKGYILGFLREHMDVFDRKINEIQSASALAQAFVVILTQKILKLDPCVRIVVTSAELK